MIMMSRTLGLLCWMLCGLAWAAEPALPADIDAPAPARAAAKTPSDKANLPKVFIIGDSISLGYTAPVTELLAGVATVKRPAGNCQHTAFGLANLEKWLGQEKWDVIHFNWGIWDTHLLALKDGALIRDETGVDPATVRLRHTPAQYEENLRKLVAILKGTGATLIWANTTPVNKRHGERLKVIAEFNEVAAKVMKENGIAINDLAGLVAREPKKCVQSDGVHFTAAASKVLAEQVSESIRAALAARAKP